ncbi:MAG: NUDIX domain-containing protein [Candidatus Pacebacteria bacterium]|nr:NUDIX domain-containing protein [Candidatus Paceibacterota bacterium]MCF7862723.1 NUDIX domain-containing protein [Candidatus Paceibacterota bacterium]
MKITEDYLEQHTGHKYIFEYEEVDSFDDLPYEKCRQCYGVCFYDDKIIIVYNKEKNVWGIIGGTIEKGETFEETLKREVKEESNMEIIKAIPIGYQKVTDPKDKDFVLYQLRYACAVRPYGPFVADPTGSVTEIKIINPKDYKKYFYWGKIGESIFKRALELKAVLY